MKAGPKAAVRSDPLDLDDLPASGAERVAQFIERYVVTPKGTGARQAFHVRPWQKSLIASVFDDPRPRLALWALPRGNGKSTISAALGLYGLHGDNEEGASVVVVAADERQAGIVFNTAVRMTQLSDPLLERTQVYKDRLYVPATGSTFAVLPAEPHRLEGLDPSLAIIDEIGVVDRRVFEVVALAAGKRAQSLTLCIGTPSPDPEQSVMNDLRRQAIEAPDPSFALVEYTSDPTHPVDCEHCWALANPGLDDLLHRDAMLALLPPRTRESTFRRARLGQWIDQVPEPWLPPGTWDTLTTARTIDDGADVVLGFDGSHNGDSTAIVAATIDPVPHLEVVACWERTTDTPADWQVPIANVEQTLRDACARWQVREIAADPFRWARTLQTLDAEGLPVVEYPQTPARMTPATTTFYEAVTNSTVTHNGDPRLARHIANATVRTDARGTRLSKEHKHSGRRIDLAIAAVMAHDRAAVHSTRSVLQVW